ncbi:site-specific integrase [Bradyrhizobium sp. JYMT SZCCT0180]|uniref:site-specific integrase n=1 Tax=Bradyrhizobium sp. JYMT SZCCT0180 TaxID=2807666 RepID=UPI001BAC49A1|nr:site-specific integrase [Bradyrhizobium sp. JYMT SZCCT0180]MBR1212052.1 site-specific integrase [Bradyrhizobium sp. JYMT SZCCT0180]
MKRPHGDGGIDERGPNKWRLRYRVNGRRISVAFSGTKTEARSKLRSLLDAASKGEHVDPSKVTVGQWIDQWILAGAPGRKKKRVSQRTLERYEQLLMTHVEPVLGARPLQKLKAAEIDKLYMGMATAGEIAPRTQHHVHVVFGALLATATRKGLIVANPMFRVEQVPNPEERLSDDDPAEDADDDIGEGLDEAQLAALIAGFKPSSLFPVVALAAASGARRNELLALRWTDLDPDKKTLRIERAWEQTKKFGLRLKPPKTKRGLRTIELDDGTIKILLAERERYQRFQAGIPDGAADVDLSLIRLPARALMFPGAPETGVEFDVSVPRNPRNFSKEFARRAGLLGFGATRFHDLRGIHSTALLDGGIPVHIVAQRIGDDPAVLLRNYVKRKRTKAADASLSTAIGALAAGFLGS